MTARSPESKYIVQTLLNYSKQQGLTDLELSRRSGVSRSSLSVMRNGKQPTMSVDSFLKICSALNVPPEHAIIGHPEGVPPQTIRVGKHTYTLTPPQGNTQ